MNKLFLRNWAVGITLTAMALGSSGKVWAEEASGDAVSVDVASELQNASDDAIAQAAQTVSKAMIEQLPSNTTDDQKTQVQEATNTLELQAQRPGFKARLISFMKKTGHVGGRAGVIVLKGTGIAGSAALATMVAPIVVGANFISTAMSGKGMVESHADMISDELNTNPTEVFASELGGTIGGMYFLVGLYAVGFTVEPWVFISAIAERAVQGSVCDKQNQGPDLKSYCNDSNSVYDHILFASANAGDFLGEGARLTVVLPVRLVRKVFHHHKKVISISSATSEAPVSN